MARLNLEKAIKKSYEIMNNNPRYSVCAYTMHDIKEKSKGCMWNAIYDALAVGFLQGYKAAMKEVERKQKEVA